MTYYPVNLAPFEEATNQENRRRATTPAVLVTALADALASIRTRDSGFASRLAAESTSDEKPTLRTTISKEHAEEVARNAASGLHMFELSGAADAYVKPMLAYYGCVQLLGAVTRAALEWRGDRSSHGLHPEYGKTLEDTVVVIEERGFFSRLANTLAIIGGGGGGTAGGGGYNLFSARDANDCPIADRASKRRPNPHAPTAMSSPVSPLPVPRKIRVGDLVSYDPAQIASNVGLFEDPAFDAVANVVLIDVLVVFAAGSVCRYRPRVWRDVLDGVDTGIRVQVDGAMARVATDLSVGATQTLLEGHSLGARPSGLYGRFAQRLAQARRKG